MRRILFLLLVLKICVCQIKFQSVSSCKDLSKISSGDPKAIYQLTRDIECKNFVFKPNERRFEGILEGRGYSVSNLEIKCSSASCGIFREGRNAEIRNLGLRNVKISSTSPIGTGALFGRCFDCKISSVFFITGNEAQRNFVSAVSNKVGGMCGVCVGTKLLNCTLEKTVVEGVTSVGGFCGDAQDCEFSECFNLGIEGKPGSMIIESHGRNAGGIVGKSKSCSLKTCGVHSGRVFSAKGYAGGVVGDCESSQLEEVYSKREVIVDCSGTGICGGICGQSSLILVENVYSKAKVAGRNSIGGIIGLARISSDQNLANVIRDSFSNPTLISTGSRATVGNVVGRVQTVKNQPRDSFLFYRVFFNSDTNSFPAIGAGSSPRDTSFPLAFNCAQMHNEILLTFNHTVWGGDRLRSEHSFNFGSCQCEHGCNQIFEEIARARFNVEINLNTSSSQGIIFYSYQYAK